MAMQDLSMSEVLKDPLIRQMLRADKVSLGAFAVLLEKAAQERGRRFAAVDWEAFRSAAASTVQRYPSAE
jgi:hypothetical protein